MDKSIISSDSNLSFIQNSSVIDPKINLEYTSDVVQFFEECCKEKIIDSVIILDHKTTDDDSTQQKVTKYRILVETGDLQYYIEKRYSDFYNLFRRLEYQLDKQVISQFPGKKLWGNFDSELIEQRKSGLNAKYIMNGLSLTEIGNLKKQQKKSLNQAEENILVNLEKLDKKNENNIQIFKDLENLILVQKIKISNEFIRTFFMGVNSRDQNDRRVRGLLTVLSKLDQETVNNSHLVCSQAMKLICNLTDHEQNREAEIFIKTFCDAKIDKIQQMKFNEHISGQVQKPCQQYAINLLNLYITKNPGIGNNESQILYLLNNDLQSFEIFSTWKQIREVNSMKSEGYVKKQFDIRSSLDKRERFNTIEDELVKFRFLPIKNDSKFLEMLKLFFNKDIEFKKIGDFSNYKDISLLQYKGECMKIKAYLKITLKLLFETFKDNYKNFNKSIEEVKIIEEKEENNFKRVMIKYIWKNANTIKRIIYLTDIYQIQSEDEIYIIYMSVQNPQNYLQANDLKHEIGEYIHLIRLKDISYHDEKHDGKLTKINWLIKHLNSNSQNFFLTEMTGESKDLINNISNLQKIVHE